jgi:8-oxo-dGTP pyrophosphatase MutT (NUDIX family)
VLLRDGEAGLETLLLRRNRRAGFVPETYVFPGGRVDSSDADPGILERVDALTPEAATARLDVRDDADPPAVAYYLAALREAFEETGLLVGALEDGSPPPPAAEDEVVDRMRGELMEDRITFADVLGGLGCRLAGGSVVYFAHWITPERAPRRFDTRFFAARVRGAGTPRVDPREMTEARWTTPARALAEHARGVLPMILPTVRTVERLGTFTDAAEALAAFSRESVVTILPGPSAGVD